MAIGFSLSQTDSCGNRDKENENANLFENF